MRSASRVTMIRLLVLAVLVLAATSWAQDRAPIAEQIAKTYGLDSFGQIEGIRSEGLGHLGECAINNGQACLTANLIYLPIGHTCR